MPIKRKELINKMSTRSRKDNFFRAWITDFNFLNN